MGFDADFYFAFNTHSHIRMDIKFIYYKNMLNGVSISKNILTFCISEMGRVGAIMS